MQVLSNSKTYAMAATLAFSSTVAHAAVQDIYEINADDAAGIQYTVDAFRAALGPLNPNNPVNADPNGRRQINWDAAPDAISDPNPFPGDFFNANVAPRARGIEFSPVGSTTGFRLSSTEASGTPVEFGFDAGFTFFSAERLFTPVGGTLFDVSFFNPADQVTPALTRGLGVVFTDVETTNSATMSFYGADDSLLYQRSVLPGRNAGLSFLGVTFTDAEVARVRIDAGLEGRDSIVMDDFIFGEPVSAPAPVPLPAPAFLLLMGVFGLGALGRRKQA